MLGVPPEATHTSSPHEKWTRGTAETTAAGKEDSGNKCQDRKLACGIDDWERVRAGRGLQKKEHRNPMCAGN